MDDETIERPPRCARPETDLTEGNAVTGGSEMLPPRPPLGTDKSVWIDPFEGPVVLP